MFQVISDSSCDLPVDWIKEKGVEVIPFSVSFDGETFLKEITEISVRDFYDRMVENYNKVFPSSSLPPVGDYCDVFTRYAAKDVPVICICISLKFSGAYQAALNAKEIVLEKYPNARIEVIDSMMDTVAQGLFTMEAVRLNDEGVGFEESVRRLYAVRETGRIFFTVGNVDYLRHGGRIGKLSGVAASILHVRPLITLRDGEIYPSGLSRSRKKSRLSVINLLEAHVRKLTDAGEDMSDYLVNIGFGYDEDEAMEFLEQVRERFKDVFDADAIKLYQIGAAISVHTGPYALGIGFLKKA